MMSLWSRRLARVVANHDEEPDHIVVLDNRDRRLIRYRIQHSIQRIR